MTKLIGEDHRIFARSPPPTVSDYITPLSTKSEKRVFLAAARERHPFLLNLHSCFQTETRIYFVMDYVSGGDLMLHIQREPFTPRRAKFYAAEVLLALEYFHKNGIVYRYVTFGRLAFLSPQRNSN